MPVNVTMGDSILLLIMIFQELNNILQNCKRVSSPPTYMRRLFGWLISTIKDKTVAIDFLKNKSKTMITFVLVS